VRTEKWPKTSKLGIRVYCFPAEWIVYIQQYNVNTFWHCVIDSVWEWTRANSKFLRHHEKKFNIQIITRRCWLSRLCRKFTWRERMIVRLEIRCNQPLIRWRTKTLLSLSWSSCSQAYSASCLVQWFLHVCFYAEKSRLEFDSPEIHIVLASLRNICKREVYFSGQPKGKSK